MAVETLQTRVGQIHVIRPDDDPETVYLRAALAGNRFGLGTNGAVL